MKVYVLSVSILMIAAGQLFAYSFLRKIEKGKRRKNRFRVILVSVYSAILFWCGMYSFVCLICAGGRLIFLWPALSLFAFARVIMLRAEIKEKPILHFPRWLRYVYRFVLASCLMLFMIVEGLVIRLMTAEPKSGLDYIVVLGAGVNGEKPSNPLQMRIQKAAEYLKENPDTVVIASGGQGRDEQISEAECIRRQLTEVYHIPAERILSEERSTSTEENLRYSMQIIGDAYASTGIVTNGFHEYRAMLLAKQEGYRNVHPVPAITLLPTGIHYTVREFFGVIHFWIKSILKN